jgi:hypothetical protein
MNLAARQTFQTGNLSRRYPHFRRTDAHQRVTNVSKREPSRPLSRFVKTRSKGHNETRYEHSHDDHVVDNIGRCAGTNADRDREDPDQRPIECERLNFDADASGRSRADPTQRETNQKDDADHALGGAGFLVLVTMD